MNVFARAVSAASFGLAVFAGLLLAAAVLVVTQMVFIRYVFNASTVWQTEFVIYSIVAATFLGSPYVLIRRGHVGVDLLPHALPPRPRMIVEALSGLASLTFAVLLAWSGWLYFHDAWALGWTTATIWKLPLWIPLLPLPVGVGFLVLQYIVELWRLFSEGTSLSQGEALPEIEPEASGSALPHKEPV